MTVKVVYSDLDGTMVGPAGCFFRAEGGASTLAPAEALAALLDAGIPLVLVSGRTRAQLLEACGIFGADGYIAELGALVGWDHGRQVELLRGRMPTDHDRVPPDLVERMLERAGGNLEFHEPWHLGHEVDVMLRGRVDVDAEHAWLAAQGFDWLRLRDNGLIPGTRMPAIGNPVHVYHLVPDGVGKGVAVAHDLERRGLRPAEAIAIGDSASDLEMAPSVGRMHLVANAVRVPAVAAALPNYPNVVVETGPLGAGWASAVRSVTEPPVTEPPVTGATPG